VSAPLLQRLRGGLIVSVQAWPGSALDDPAVIAAMAAAAEANGAVAVRVAGIANLKAVRARVSLPIVGLVKRASPGFEPYITPAVEDIRAVAAAGADIAAFDATDRLRPGATTVGDLIAAARAAGCAPMADCSTASDAGRAADAGAEIVATTLCGYTNDTAGRPLPALDLVRELARLDAFAVCEGGVTEPQQLREALDAGADAVVVGTAITNVDWLVRRFAGSADTAPNG
jgi:N-acylglucosamine-6-phosphate 2-epimerase